MCWRWQDLTDDFCDEIRCCFMMWCALWFTEKQTNLSILNDHMHSTREGSVFSCVCLLTWRVVSIPWCTRIGRKEIPPSLAKDRARRRLPPPHSDRRVKEGKKLLVWCNYGLTACQDILDLVSLLSIYLWGTDGFESRKEHLFPKIIKFYVQ